VQVTGTCVIRMNGRSLRSETGATMHLGGKERTARYADHDLLGYSQKPIAAVVSGNLAHTAQTDLQAIADATDVTIIFETDTGVRYTMRNAFSTKPPELTGGEGQVSFEFNGKAMIQS